jgi:hypothetical protein
MDITVEQEGNTDRQPAPDVTPEPIFRVASRFMVAKLLFVTNEVGCSRIRPKDRLPWTSWRGGPRRTLRILADPMVANYVPGGMV